MSYLTIAQDFEYEQTIKKSRFICSLTRISDEKQAREFIDTITKRERKANHHCFAYLLGDHDEIQRESDDGEPSGTAGVPILQSLQLQKVHDVVAVVTRYFGGIKLGAGGLIRAYSNTTSNALNEVGLVERVQQMTLNIKISYASHDQLLYFLQQQHISVANEQYGVDIEVTIFVNQSDVDTIQKKIIDLLQNNVSITPGKLHYTEIPFIS
ncbi:YigZ family protein [Paucilactobacillus kaifaensis]|uniref:YigZ family protein n=1 Tax=Paucilactobacillus kaifaensis TaxID=2559921 RepID=UPI0010F4A6EC|nr:YigZ family protein [Paucilactobacillus kaifaensis]